MASEEQVAILRQGGAVWNQWRLGNPEVHIDLSSDLLGSPNSAFSGMDLSGAKLRGANLGGLDFSGTNLSYASLDGTNLTDANLTEAKLVGANLTDADFSAAYLAGTDLDSANLHRAYFWGTFFLNTNFGNANLDHSIFANVDLGKIKGLETIRHRGPSTIGIDTIYLSKGQIPEIFLRGCGVPKIFIEYMHSLTAKPFEFYSCFISYSHADATFAQRLHDTLQGKGVRCWLDEKDARLGVPITHNIESGIRLTDKFLLCCSQESLGSGWVNFEIDLALHRETELRKNATGDQWRLIPLDLDGHLFNPEYSGGALRIRNRLAGDFIGWKTDSDKFDRQIAKVMQAIRIEGGEK